jgi:hypothetical protein
MNNRETAGVSPDAADPDGKNKKRKRQREADEFGGRIGGL